MGGTYILVPPSPVRGEVEIIGCRWVLPCGR